MLECIWNPSVQVLEVWNYISITLRKTNINISPENRLSQKESSLQTTFFRDYVSFREGNDFRSSKMTANGSPDMPSRFLAPFQFSLESWFFGKLLPSDTTKTHDYNSNILICRRIRHHVVSPEIIEDFALDNMLGSCPKMVIRVLLMEEVLHHSKKQINAPKSLDKREIIS